MAWNRKEVARRSPIKGVLMPKPGDSLGARAERVFWDRVLFPGMLAGFYVVMALLEWYRVAVDLKPSPWGFTIVAMGAIVYAARKVLPALREMRELKLGRDGERSVAERLETDLRGSGYEVLHDIPALDFNIDHLVIGPTGVFVIETKTRRKRTGSPHVVYDGKRVLVDGWEPDRNPVEQARAIAQWVRERLREWTGRDYPVRPVVVFPGWFVEPMPQGADVWVLNEKAAITFILGARSLLDAQERAQAAGQVRRHIEYQAELAAARTGSPP